MLKTDDLEQSESQLISEEFDIVPKGSSSWRIEKPLLLIAILLLSAMLSFGLGRLSVQYEEKVPIQIDQTSAISVPVPVSRLKTTPPIPLVGEGGARIYASKSGTKYYFENCSSRVLEENKIWFNSEIAAQNAGYALATNCR